MKNLAKYIGLNYEQPESLSSAILAGLLTFATMALITLFVILIK